jgi:hypothetical protein
MYFLTKETFEELDLILCRIIAMGKVVQILSEQSDIDPRASSGLGKRVSKNAEYALGLLDLGKLPPRKPSHAGNGPRGKGSRDRSRNCTGKEK